MSMNHNPMRKRTFTPFLFINKVHKNGKKCVINGIFGSPPLLAFMPFNPFLQWHHTLGISPPKNALVMCKKHSPCLEECAQIMTTLKEQNKIPFWYCFLAAYGEMHIQ
jgi:hypothetical protein